MKKVWKKGFTLTEVIVVLVLIAVVAAVAIPAAIRYQKQAEFRKNESNAKTAYLAAESALTWYRSSGAWEEFRKEVIQYGVCNDTFGEGDKEKNRIYAITLNSSKAPAKSPSQELVRRLLSGSAYDKDVLNAAIAIEIDIETGQVYSAFYGTKCFSLRYDASDSEGEWNISSNGENRTNYQKRKERLLGYYSVEDVTNVVNLKPVQLKVTSISLVNGETLSLNWASNSKYDNLDVDFEISFYNRENDEKLFSTVVNWYRLRAAGANENQMAGLTLTDKDGNVIGGTSAVWYFPLTYQAADGRNGRFSLVLDGMMSAELLERLEAANLQGNGKELAREYSTSITRLGDEIPVLAAGENPPEIYGVIQAKPTYENMGGDFREYNSGSPMKSNAENTLYADSSLDAVTGLSAEITKFRHLSNLRYYNKEETATFTLTGRNMDWEAEGTGLYDAAASARDADRKVLLWKENEKGAELEFPAIRLLSKKHTLQGNGNQTRISNLRLGAGSIPSDPAIEQMYPGGASDHYSRYLGLFCEAEGTIRKLSLQNPRLFLAGTGGDGTPEPMEEFEHMYGVGILCGRSAGTLSDITIKGTDQALTVCLAASRNIIEAGKAEKAPAGIGGFAGILAGKKGDGTLTPLTDSGQAALEKLTMEGKVYGMLPNPPAGQGQDPQVLALDYRYGIGGIFGYAWTEGKTVVKECTNHADVSGNLFAGGIGGGMRGGYKPGETDSEPPALSDCENDGQVRCTVSHKDEEGLLEGRYFGGILGFGRNLRIKDSYSASGRYAKDRYIEKDLSKLLGQYVGGIIGYGSSSQLTGCSTKKGGYILGSDYVGGIAGGLSNDVSNAIVGSEGIDVTTNASYVIGNNYVGGIVGKNDGTEEEITIANCVNNGVAAGYGRYVGGIAGYNGEKGILQDCASYLSDYDGSVFDMIVTKWEAAADCSGGLAGYNNGKILFGEDSQAITVKSVSTVVAGRNFVGGVIGFNDVKGTLDVNYTLIGGRIYAYGNGAGGCIGVNASPDILTGSLEIKPSSVQGVYYVGGCIGANVVDLQEDVEMGDIRADNVLGSIAGEAYTGGIIGYQRTYTKDQLTEAHGAEVSLLEALLASANGEAKEGKALLPQLGAGNIPTKVLPSKNPYLLTITDFRNREDDLSSAGNNIPIQSCIYAGGLVGYCEEDSLLVLKYCKNAGNISKYEGGNPTTAQGVLLTEYLNRNQNTPLLPEEEQELEGLRVFMVGGVVSANLKNQVIDHCANTGSMNGFVGLGGIVGFNAGGVFGCGLEDNFGNAALDYIGGIAGLNLSEDSEPRGYSHTQGEQTYVSGTIADCYTQSGRTVSGGSYVGGITGYNMKGAVLSGNRNEANITAAGDYAGGIAGVNAGKVEVLADTSQAERRITGNNGIGIGGIVGRNDRSGSIRIQASNAGSGSGSGTGSGSGAGTEETVAVNEGVSITGREKVGGIVGIHNGSLSAQEGYLTNRAALVQASEGMAGGIAGEAGGGITRARNRGQEVKANRGPAGGIVAVNQAGITLSECQNLGNVISDGGYAGGIAAENQGVIQDCTVGTTLKGQQLVIRSRRKQAEGAEIGAVCAVNDGQISGSMPLGNVMLSGDSDTFGGIAGKNRGTVEAAVLTYLPEIESTGKDLAVGGGAGRNEGTLKNLTAKGLELKDFVDYRYLGGIVGVNEKDAHGIRCNFTEGIIKEGRSAPGNCYGGIAGNNYGTLESCEVSQITMQVQGVYTATSTSTASQKEALATHVGGIAGKNEEGGEILSCLITGTGNRMEISNGMAGGIAGFNNGRIYRSGDECTEELMFGLTGQPVDRTQTLLDNAGNLQADPYHVNWENNGGTPLENYRYANGTKVTEGKGLLLTMAVNGNLGGITAYNGHSGQVSYCATGNWYLNNKSDAIGVGTGGVIGMNESGYSQSFLVNRAFVGRQISRQDTNRFAGGIIGNQNNTTEEGWKLSSCLNYGTVYCLRTHYSGGILGQWTGTGGTISNCYNYGNLQTTYGTGWVGASGGIVAQLYHAYENNEYNIISCGNYGNIYGRTGKSNVDCANDSAGILGNITAYDANADQAQNYTVQVLDCVNGSGVEIYSASMASGIVGFLSCDNPRKQEQIGAATQNITLRIERCRNYAKVLMGGGGNKFAAGIFGERYAKAGAEHTFINNCYSVNPISSGTYLNQNYPIISYTANTGNVPYLNAAENYFLSEEGTANSGFHSFGLVNQNSYTVTEPGDRLKRAGAKVYYLLNYNGEDYGVSLNAGSVNKSQLKIENDIVYQNNREIGAVLFKVDQSLEPGADYPNLASVLTGDKNPGSGKKEPSRFDEHVRFAYQKVEDTNYILQNGSGAESRQMAAPERVLLTKNGSQARVTVIPAAGTDPFCYTGELYRKNADGTSELLLSDLTFYTEEYQFRLPGGAEEGEIYLALRACSMFEQTAPSVPVTSLDLSGQEMLVSPDIRIELNPDGNGYRFRLMNPEAYPADGSWQILVKFMDGSPALAGTPDGEGYFGARSFSSDSLQQLLVQAVSLDNTRLPSAQISVPVYLPAYRPSITLNEAGSSTGKAKPGVTISGTTLADFGMTVTLDASNSGNVTTPPVYRAELLGDWKDSSGTVYPDTVLASTEILAAANGVATAAFGSLPEYAADAVNLKVRVWYAQSGLGPVYTYYNVPEGEANIRTLKWEIPPGGTEPQYVWEYGATPVLSGGGFADCRWTMEQVFEFLPRPVLMDGTNVLPPEYGTDNHLQYTFRWDQGVGEYQPGDTYLVSLSGIKEGRPVSLVTDQEVSGNTYTADAEHWAYEQVELTVTRKGDGTQKKIGCSSTQTYLVGQRLQRPAQPTVENKDVNELFYNISWTPIQPETGCGSYGIYLKTYLADGSLSAPVELGQADVSEKTDGMYQKKLDLSAYSGQSVLLYVIAQAGHPQYVDSVEGITYELAVPKRVNTPTVNWNRSWDYDRNQPVTEDGFTAADPAGGSLKITLEPGNPESIPSGDSSYLLKAYVFETQTQAEAARAILGAGNSLGEGQGLLATYPALTGDELLPVQMETEPGGRFGHTLTGLSAEYAGKWMLCYTRISSGNGQVSSLWVENPQLWQLPYVKLPAPEVMLESQEREIAVTDVTNPDLPVQKTWKAERIALKWNGEALADTHLIQVKKKDGSSQQLRIVEHKETGTVSVYVQKQQPDGTFLWEEKVPIPDTQSFELPEVQISLNSTYTLAGITYRYQTTIDARLEVSWDAADGFAYTLLLPDAERLVTENGTVLTESALKETAFAAFTADVAKNAPDLFPGQASDAYLPSDELEVALGN